MKIKTQSTDSNGKTTEEVIDRKGSDVLKIQAQPHVRLSIQVQSDKPLPDQKMAAGNIKKIGNNLLVEVEDEGLFEITDFYSNDGVSLGSISWSLVASDGSITNTITFPALEVQALASKVSQDGAEVSGFLFPVNFGLAAAGAGVAVVAAKSGSKKSSSDTVAAKSYSVSVVFGPETDAGVGTKVELFTKEGKSLGLMKFDAATGKYSLTDKTGYSGVVVARLTDTDSAPDYMDEATKTFKNIGATEYFAVSSVGTGDTAISLSITPLTTVAARSLGVAVSTTADGSSVVTVNKDATTVTQTNQAVAKAFNIVDASGQALDISKVEAKAVVNTDGTANSSSNAYGQALAIVSQAEATSGKTTEQLVTSMASALVVTSTGVSKVGSFTNSASGAAATEVQTVLSTGAAQAVASGQVDATAAAVVLKQITATSVSLLLDSDSDIYVNAQETTVALKIKGSWVVGSTVELFSGGTPLNFKVGAGIEASSYTTLAGGSTTELSLTASDLSTLKTEDGTYPISVKVTPAGGVAATSNSLNLVVDAAAPTASTVSDGTSADLTNSAISFTVTFDEDVVGTVGTSNFTATNASITSVTPVNAKTYTVVATPTAGVASGSVALSLVAGTLKDAAGNALANADLSSKDSQAIDTAAPTITAKTEGSMAPSGNLSLTLSEVVTKGTSGAITIYNAANDTVVETINITTDAVTLDTASGTSTVVTINPSNDLGANTSYYAKLSDNAFKDTAGNNLVGISDKTTWTFSAVSLSTSVLSKVGSTTDATINSTDMSSWTLSGTVSDQGSGAQSITITKLTFTPTDGSSAVSITTGLPTVDPTTKAWTLANSTSWTNLLSSGKTYNVTVELSASVGGSSTTGSGQLTGVVIDTTPPAFTNSGSSTSFAENTDIATVVFDAVATDASTIASYSLTAGGDKFSVGSDGKITFRASPDYETATTASFTVRATDNNGNYADKSVTVNITNVNEAPVLTAPTPIALIDTASSNTFTNQTGTLSATDVDGGTTLSYGISGGTTETTTINTVTYDVSKGGTYGTLYVVSTGTDKGKYVYVPNANAINALSANQSETFTVTTSDSSLSDSKTLTINVTGANDAPTVTAGAASATLVEAGGVANATTGTASATIALSKADVDGTVSYDTSYLTSNGWSTANAGVTYTKAGTYGTATLTIATGVVSYALDDTKTATQGLTAAQSVSDAFGTVQVTDGTATALSSAISFAITGSNDTPTLMTYTSTPDYANTGADQLLFSNTAINAIDSNQTIKGLMFTVSGVDGSANERIKFDGQNIALNNGISGTTSVNGIGYSVSVANGTATVTLTSAAGLDAAIMQGLINTMAYNYAVASGASSAGMNGDHAVTLTQITDSGSDNNVTVLTQATTISDNTAPTGGTGMSFTSVTSAITDTAADRVTNQATGSVLFTYIGTDLASGEYFEYRIGMGNWGTTNLSRSGKVVTISSLDLSVSPTVEVRAVDASGNATATLISQTITYDSTPPTLDLDLNAQGTNYTVTATVTGIDYYIYNTGSSGSYRAVLTEINPIGSISIGVNTAVSPSTLASEYIKVGSTQLNLDGSNLASSVSVNNQIWAVTYSAGVFIFVPTGGSASSGLAQALIRSVTYGATTLPSGANRTLSIGVVDAAGNSTSSAVATVSADNVGPVIDLDGSTGGFNYSPVSVSLATVNAGVALTSSSSLTEGSSVATVRIAVSGLLNGTSEQLIVGATSYNANGTSVTGSVTVSGTTWNVSYADSTFSFTYVSGTAASAAQAQALIASATYKNSASTGIDGVRTFTFSAVDSVNNVTATSAVATISVNAANPALVSVGTATAGTTVVSGVTYTSYTNGSLTTLDANADGVLGDQFIVTFSEAVKVSNVTTTTNWTNIATLGTGATITALNAVTVNGVQYATQFLFKAGTSTTYTTGTTLTITAANVIDTGGATASSNQVVTMTDIVAASAPTPPQSISTDNYVSSNEKSASTTIAYVTPTAVAGDVLKVYYDGTLIKSQSMTASTTSTSVFFSTTDWGSDGNHQITARVQDAAGNLSAVSASKSVVVDTAVQGISNVLVVTDTVNPTVSNAGDVVRLVFAESVAITTTTLPTSNFGTGYTVAAVGAVNGKSTQWDVTLGSNPTLAGGQTITTTMGGITDVAGNTGSATFTLNGDVYNTLGQATIGNVATDNVIVSGERSTVQTVRIQLSRAAEGDFIDMAMDGVAIDINGATSGGRYVVTATDVANGYADVSISANVWGGDGERTLGVSMQRGTGSVVKALNDRHVYVSADGAHWAASNIMWFDPETMVTQKGVFNTWTSSAGGSTATRTGTTGALIANSAGRYAFIDTANGGYFASGTPSTFTLPTGTSSMTAITVFKQTATDYNLHGLLYYSGTTGYFLSVDNRNSSNQAVNDGTNKYALGFDNYATSTTGSNNSAGVNSWTVDRAVLTSGTLRLFANGTQSVYNPSQSYNVTGTPKMQFGGDTTFLSGDSIMVNGLLTSAQSMEIDVYLANKYQSMGTLVSPSSVGATYNLSLSSNAAALLDDVLNLANETGAGNDTITTAGADYVQAGAGNDTLITQNLNFRLLDGGFGTDTLKLSSAYSGSSTIYLSDYVSNARGTGSNSTANTRVNDNGFHKLLGIEVIDLSTSTAAQALTVAMDDVNQLSEDNKLWVKLGTADGTTGASSVSDTLTATGFTGSVTWGYFTHTETDGSTAVYDRKWTGTSSTGGVSQSVELYASGGQFAKIDTGSLVSSAAGSDTLAGSASADVFAWLANQSGTDVVTNFTRSQGDKLDLRELLAPVAFDLAHISDYLQLSQSGSDAVLKVDTDGGGNFTSNAQTITLTGAWNDLNVVSANSTASLTQLNMQHVVLLA